MDSTPTGPINSRPPNTAPDPPPPLEHHQLTAAVPPDRPPLLHAPLIKLAASLGVGAHSAAVLVDSGATTNFIDQSYVQRHALPTEPIAQVQTITLGDGSQRSTSLITRPLGVRVGTYTDSIPFVVVPLAGCDAVLGMPWLQSHNPSIDWSDRSIVVGAHKLRPPRYRDSCNLNSSSLSPSVSAVSVAGKGMIVLGLAVSSTGCTYGSLREREEASLGLGERSKRLRQLAGLQTESGLNPQVHILH